MSYPFIYTPITVNNDKIAPKIIPGGALIFSHTLTNSGKDNAI